MVTYQSTLIDLVKRSVTHLDLKGKLGAIPDARGQPDWWYVTVVGIPEQPGLVMVFCDRTWHSIFDNLSFNFAVTDAEAVDPNIHETILRRYNETVNTACKVGLVH